MTNGFSATGYFDEHYNLRRILPTFNEHVAEWEALSTDAHFAEHTHDVLSYGDHPRHTFELFKVRDGVEPKGLAVFLHGGFWRAMEREQSRFVATPFLEHGYDCAIGEYRLLPEFVLGDLVNDTASMLLRLTEISGQYQLKDNVILSGHSAGAHLAVFGLKHATERGYKPGSCSLLLFSGVFDIFPVSITSLRDELQMSEQDIARWSIYGSNPRNDVQPLFVFGGDETEDFKRQSIVGAQHLGNPDLPCIISVPNTNHLTLMTRFATDRRLSKDLLGKLTWRR